MVPVCQTGQAAHIEEVMPVPRTATQQYVWLGTRWLKFTRPFLLVFLVTKGLPGRGLVAFVGVDSSTGIFAAGVCKIVTSTAALVTAGFGDGEKGEDDVTGGVV
jgi:hypothetical protein